MLTILVSCRAKEPLRKLKQSIAKTCGCPYTLMPLINERGQYSLGKAYNLLATQAKTDYLVFIHLDITFKTQGWGKRIIAILKQQEIGLVGVAGASHKTACPSAWWTNTTIQENIHINILQKYPNKKVIALYANPQNSPLSEVIVVDGVFLAMRKTVWNENKFDEKNYTGFHLYDLDIAMQIRKKYKVVVTDNILIQHESFGVKDQSWIENSLQFSKKWKQVLPATLKPINKKTQYNLEYAALTEFISHGNTARFFWGISLLPYLLYIIRLNPIEIRNTIRLLKKIIRK